ncbi:ferredoxin [Desulfovibrio sp. ZJ200]|uniref:ATP-binding protein n=1 Tax=Desulfovibrio sp. ZJ200 TaxID=2709792 RepID=UPI0013ECDAF0|nr:ferredoxin [Desulfovibrio sp. ZJ200]
MKRQIIEIDEAKCNGCGQCVLDCAENALAVIEGKARLISEVYCDGLGACLNCPQGALTLTVREAPPFDEAAALAAKARSEAARGPAGQAAAGLPAGGCPGGAARILRPLTGAAAAEPHLRADLPAWPIQLRLLPPQAPFLVGAHLLLAAQCAGFALPRLHQNWLSGRVPLIACPKLDDNKELQEKLNAILRVARPVELSVLRMSVPCCQGLERLARQALEGCGSSAALHCHVVQLERFAN